MDQWDKEYSKEVIDLAYDLVEAFFPMYDRFLISNLTKLGDFTNIEDDTEWKRIKIVCHAMYDFALPDDTRYLYLVDISQTLVDKGVSSD